MPSSLLSCARSWALQQRPNGSATSRNSFQELEGLPGSPLVHHTLTKDEAFVRGGGGGGGGEQDGLQPPHQRPAPLERSLSHTNTHSNSHTFSRAANKVRSLQHHHFSSGFYATKSALERLTVLVPFELQLLSRSANKVLSLQTVDYLFCSICSATNSAAK